nr:RagB/SusD family nutrient uptake outer membrane protein [Prevotella sp.]
MKSIRFFKHTIIACALSLPLVSCTDDLNQYPHIETTSEQVYTTADNYETVLGKIYTAMVTNGQGKGGDNADLTSNMGYDYMRCYFNLQECGTDEIASTWLSGDKTSDITYLSWDANDPWVADMYYRIYYNITLCNEFLRNCTEDKVNSFSGDDQTDMRHYRAEARFMRALLYYHALDLYRYIPFVTENDPIGSYTPPRYTPDQTFAYIESELKDIADDLYPASECPYGRASQGADYALLAKLYLNAEVYTGVAKYTDCITACNNAIAQGYTLDSDYSKLFNADNDKRTDEIIFALPVDAEKTVSWGATTYIICGQLGNTSADIVPADYGVQSAWGMFRSRGELPQKFYDEGYDETTMKDGRFKFFTKNQSQYLNAADDQTQGYFPIKWTNLTDEGEAASNTADGGVNTDYPMFRLADVYLMYAEAVLRGGEGGTLDKALGYCNALRERALGNTDGDIKTQDLTLDYILDERARELYLECTRRTDLIRYGEFTTSKYVWQWKGGTKDGMAVDSKYNIYPIPTTDLTANPNLYNENY